MKRLFLIGALLGVTAGAAPPAPPVPVALFYAPQSGRFLLVEAPAERWTRALALHFQRRGDSSVAVAGVRVFLGPPQSLWPLDVDLHGTALDHDVSDGVHFTFRTTTGDHVRLGLGHLGSRRTRDLRPPREVSTFRGEPVVKLEFDPARIDDWFIVYRREVAVLPARKVVRCIADLTS